MAAREYQASAESTDTFGRVVWRARNHLMVADGPVENGCPGEALGPGELFLGGIATCAVELIQVLAHERQIDLAAASATVRGLLGSGQQHHPGVTVFDSIELRIELTGVSIPQGTELVEGFKGR